MNKTIGIIAEYNPFHNGHMALIKTAKDLGYTNCVAVMSGNFVQRCSPAITEKRIRAKAALLSGVDLVLELPVPYATATAQLFAMGAVATLKQTGLIDTLCFGSEIGNTKIMEEIVDVLESEQFSKLLNKFLAEGITFAKARSLSIGEILGEEAARVSAEPNNLLGIEYINSARKLNWKVEFLTVSRFSVGHHSQEPEDKFASASFLREQETDWGIIQKYIPSTSLELYKQAEQEGLYPARLDKLETAILSKLRSLDIKDIEKLPDISEGIENRFYNEIQKAVSLGALMEGLKTKRYPLSRVRRIVLTAFLGIEKRYVTLTPPYIRILGFNQSGKKLLTTMKKKADVQFSSSLAEISKMSGLCKKFAIMEAKATDQYTLSLPEIKPCGYDYVTPVVFLD